MTGAVGDKSCHMINLEAHVSHLDSLVPNHDYSSRREIREQREESTKAHRKPAHLSLDNKGLPHRCKVGPYEL